MQPTVDLLVPVKPLALAKTRLLGAADRGTGEPAAHARLALALARDTLTAAAAAGMVRRLVAISSDPVVHAAVTSDGVALIADEPDAGLNPALLHGEQRLRRADPAAAVAALQADLPALRPDELDAAVRAALGTGRRAFCADRAGTGTTLLVAPPGQPLDPCFGPGSAASHRGSGAVAIEGPWPGLRCDVDTGADLSVARRLGLGHFTRSALAHPDRPDHGS
ncbi:MAG: 2-phospho-L-lactate guanylyltransferase [Pseudonocardiaceae bacterium]